MGLRKILTTDEPALHKVCRPVEKFDWRLHKLLDDMRETLAQANGVGLAAPQVGILRRVVVVDTGEDILELVNPELLETDGEQEGAEGCLSVPGKYGLVKRPYYAKVRAQDREGQWFEAEGEEIVAAFRTIRDQLVFTNKRIISIDVQGLTGLKKSFAIMPYSKVQFFTIQTPGFAELVSDSELYLMFSNGFTAKFEFRGSVDIGALGRTISTYVL